MHTATQLDQEMFDIRLAGTPSNREAVFPDWGPRDRLGVVLNCPLGAVGASYLIQLSITAFYDARPNRRTTHGQYPEIYLFHVGQRFGSHLPYDFWPPRKEVFAGDRPEEVLDVILDRAITRLVVPDGPRRAVEYPVKEPATAGDRLASCFAYSPTGQVMESDITIAASDPRTEENPLQTLEPQRFVETIDSLLENATKGLLEDSPLIDQPNLELTRDVRQLALERMNEVNESDRARAVDARRALLQDGVITESYRRISVEEALERLASNFT